MKTVKDSLAQRTLGRQQGGQALVIVLGFVMLMTVLVLVFFASVLTERASTKAAASGNSARQLAQSAVQLVEGTITQATVPSTTDSTATSIAWASQPGMIRTYGTYTAGSGYTASSAPLAYYKLYSSTNMIVTTPAVGSYVVDSDIIKTWDQYPSLYTDLNSPIPNPAADANNPFVYPIVDPRAALSTGVAVDGFGYATKTAISGVTVDGVQQVTTGNVTSSTSPPLLPMPVAWIYVLKDGTLTAPTSGTTTTATFPSTGTTAPTATNPIVGRFGYWTDDECGKINLNTASEGTYWDTPLSNSGTPPAPWGSPGDAFTYPQTAALGDMVLVNYIGAQHEYQRYPGHPATTCLSEVFGASLASFASTARASLVQTIDNATPRVNDTVTPDSSVPATTSNIASTMGGTTFAASVVPIKYDRLYPTVDDFNFTPTRTVQSLGSSSITTQQVIEQTRFFLTTASKAPELNPFGLPRIAIWPVWGDSYAGSRSTFDSEILQCATVAKGAAAGSQHRMVFTRADSTSPTNDWTLTDSNGNKRNQQLYEYLQTLTGGNSLGIPGFGGNFLSKYPNPDQDQILTEIFDYIRCTNLDDQTAGKTASYTPTVSSGSQIYNGAAGAATTGNTGPGEVVPIQISGTPTGTTTNGAGRIATISELALCLVKCDDRQNTANADAASNLATTVNITDPDSGAPTSWSPATQTCVEWVVIPKLFCPMAGYPGLGHNIRIHYSSFSLNINGNTVTNPSPLLDLHDVGRISANTRDSTVGDNIGCATLVDSGAPRDSMFPTGLVVVTGNDANTGGSGTINIYGTFTVQIFSPGQTITQGATPTGNPIQTLNFTIGSSGSPVTVPIPTLTYNTAGSSPGPPPNSWMNTFRSSTYTQPASAGAAGSLVYSAPITGTTASKGPNRCPGPQQFNEFLKGGESVRSVVSTGNLTGSAANSLEGDMRLVAMTSSVPSSAYNLAQKWSGATAAAYAAAAPASTDYAVDSLRLGNLFGLTGAYLGSLVPTSLSTSYSQSPELPVLSTLCPQMANDGNLPADWDNAQGLMMDGPLMNHPDEGTSATPSSSGSGATNPSFYTWFPYVGNYDTYVSGAVPTTTLFSPNRLVSSPVIFGSLPVGLDHPWRTLLFRPATLPGYDKTATTYYTHPGGSTTSAAPTTYAYPPDHVLLDFFRMPIVEPYCISEPLATAGKINLNTQIAPFTYITRTTGLRAVLKSVMITALNPTGFIGSYKVAFGTSGDTTSSVLASNYTTTIRYPIDLTDTVNLMNVAAASTDSNPNGYTAFPEFNRTTPTATAPNFFVSPSQICDLPLIPSIPSSGNNSMSGIVTSPITALTGNNSLATFWAAASLTGDNTLEHPYSLIYPRVTTQSNTFTVHVRAQSLVKVPNSTQNVWTEPLSGTSGAGQVTGEYRGSFTIEKYYDPTNAAIYSPSTSATAALTDSQDASIPTDARVVSSITTSGGTTSVQPVSWRLLESKRFGQ